MTMNSIAGAPLNALDAAAGCASVCGRPGSKQAQPGADFV
jgi:hypothetical protein